jgi:glycine cleavage system T protein (aminomethyltransferase)
MSDIDSTVDFLKNVPTPSRILRPGYRALPLGVERYVVAGAGSLSIQVFTGDTLTLTNIEGAQPCEMIGAETNGTVITAAMFGEAADANCEGIHRLLNSQTTGSQSTRALLKRLKVDLASASTLKIFNAKAPAGSKADLSIQIDGVVVIAAPGGIMDFTTQDTTTPIEVLVKRISPARHRQAPEILPLADPLTSLHIDARTARSYTVKAGEYIQIIDVSGRQCTDFQAFSMRSIDNNTPLALDATITRSLLGLTTPVPGLPAKAFDMEMTPLVEVIQDTCGRHDIFLTACNARYYDDMGYPGHVNCTDNFNATLDEFGIAPRKGWEAINYFYNTMIDAQNQLYFDEPWTRPGDYVLLRALTDLVCVSSACPCDIDAANGWNPTDIHVLTYSEKELFSKGVAFRKTPDADVEMTKETAFHKPLSALTRDFGEYNGYWLANRFNNDGPIDEYWACRERAAVMDLSPLRKFEVTGPDARALLQYCMTRNIAKLSTGQVVYTAMCYEHGGMIDDGTVYCLGDNNFRWIGGSDVSGIWLREQAQKLGLEAWVRTSTDQMHNIAVQGPCSRDILSEIIWTPPAQPELAELDWFRFTVGRIGKFSGPPVVVSRTGFTGELGYEIFCHPKDAEAVFAAVWQAGEKFNMAPLGLEALNLLRIEAGLVFAGYEFCDQTDPFEAGIGFTVALKTKPDDFIGRDALIERKAHPQRQLVGLEIAAREDVGNGDTIHIGRAQIGEITSAMRSPILKANIALARVNVTHASIDTEVEIGKLDGQQKRLPARIVRFPHYDPEKKRPRS